MSAGTPHHRVDDPDGPKDDATEYGDDLAVVELLWASAENNIAGLQRLVAHGMPVHAQDYDKRTALHLAAAEGQLDAVRHLIAHGHPLNVRDRWNATPLDDRDFHFRRPRMDPLYTRKPQRPRESFSSHNRPGSEAVTQPALTSWG